jgi:catechol 2,3-dioxygenase-like lactoylglutathione lyase family enzyme
MFCCVLSAIWVSSTTAIRGNGVFTHVMVGVEDFDQSKAFYDAIFAVLNIGPAMGDGKTRAFYVSPNGGFGITKPINGEPPSIANGGTIGFGANSAEQVDAWHAAGLAAGGTSCESPPGIRDLGPSGKLYAAYLRDPIGNKLVASYRIA